MKAFILANISDALSTIAGILVGGTEANPLINLAIEATSVPEALLVKLAIAFGVGLAIHRWRPRLLTVPTLAFAGIAISNSVAVLSHI
jgi:hypothetical protein